MRVVLWVSLVSLVACTPAPKPAEPPKPDPAEDVSYIQTLDKLQAMYRSAEDHLNRRKRDEAAAILAEAQPLISQVMSVPRPSLRAMQIVSDLDDLYGRMLFSNRHYGWARMIFQKNVARWTNWKPQTEETARRKKAAEAAVAECDRRLGE